MQRIREDVRAAATTDAKVLISGESGVGKEIAARLIHSQGRRAPFPLVTVNCAALTETLLETELFGHTRGSFTGAYRDRAGVLESAHRGTVFMDEIGETSPRMQGLLLRFLETGEIQRVGSDQAKTRVDVRVISATNRVLIDSVAARTFREDLFYRLNVIQVTLPPLRERREDIPDMLAYFLRHFSQQYQVPQPAFAPDAMGALMAHHWPGNIRELKNVIERLVVRNHQRDITLADLPEDLWRATAPSAASGRPTVAQALFDRIVNGGESFWAVAYAPFISRDLTRDDLRALVKTGLERTSGNYRVLVELFNMPPDDYKRFLGFLRKYHCHMPFQQFRSSAREGSGTPSPPHRPIVARSA